MREEQALAALRRGENTALAWIIQRYTPYVASVVGSVAGAYASQPDVEELVSDVFLALWRGAGQVRPEKLRPWLGAVARNKARDFLRALRVELPLEDDVLSLEADPMQDGAEEDELRRAVREAVLSMEQPDREIFLRHYYYLQPLKEVAGQMGMRESTVKSRLRRGRLALKRHLTERGFADGLPDQ